MDFIKHLLDEVFVHGGSTTVGVQMSFGKFDGFTKHHTEGNVLEL